MVLFFANWRTVISSFPSRLWHQFRNHCYVWAFVIVWDGYGSLVCHIVFTFLYLSNVKPVSLVGACFNELYEALLLTTNIPQR
uniref:Uncharacterized protein n=1 Tax=Rhipicephalus microplus TaxID=6941 RepID=A0A6G5A593_RHIMP